MSHKVCNNGPTRYGVPGRHGPIHPDPVHASKRVDGGFKPLSPPSIPLDDHLKD
jgi:hypothetical protein